MLEHKLRQPAPGQPKPALTRLKELGAEERAAVMQILRENTYQHAQKIISARLGFECRKGTLFRFFSWQAKQDAIRQSEDMLAQAERFMQQQRPDWTEEQMRELAATFFIMHALENRDSGQFVKVARLGILEKHHHLESRKLDLHLEKYAQVGSAEAPFRKNQSP